MATVKGRPNYGVVKGRPGPRKTVKSRPGTRTAPPVRPRP